MSSRKRDNLGLKIKVTFWSVIIGTMLFSIIKTHNSLHVIIPWTIAAICFIKYKLAAKHKVGRVEDQPRKRIRRYK